MRRFKTWLIGAAAAACVIASPLPALATEEEGPAESEGDVLEVTDVLSVSSHIQLQELATATMQSLAAQLEKAKDEASARAITPTAERAYMELQLLAARFSMLPSPTRAEQKAIDAQIAPYEAARLALRKQVERIARSSVLNSQLRAIMFPLDGQMKLIAASQANSLISQLQTLRSQIELYKLQHNDQAPEFRKSGWSQLTRRTDATGGVGEFAPYGPYLHAAPRNPMNNKSRLLLIKGSPTKDFRYAREDCGFVYDEKSGRIWGLDDEGRIFDESAELAALD
jgi:hypothetical protein